MSYNFVDKEFVRSVSHYLGTQDEVTTYFYSHQRLADRFPERLAAEIKAADRFVLFVGGTLGEWQKREMKMALREKKRKVVVALGPTPDAEAAKFSSGCDPVRVPETLPEAALACARTIVELLPQAVRWREPDGVPPGYPFAYEKDMIELYLRSPGDDPNAPDQRRAWLPATWPGVTRRKTESKFEPADDSLGQRRREDAAILIDARLPEVGRRQLTRLTLPEAGMRGRLRYPRTAELCAGLVVSGGIAPGINAVIKGIVERHLRYTDQHGHHLSLRGSSADSRRSRPDTTSSSS